MKRLLPLVLCFLALHGSAWADVVTLKDGTRLEGEIKRVGDNYTIKDAAGIITNVPTDKVARIELRPQTGNDAAMARLQSLRRAADNISDIRQILDRYKSFMDQNAGTPAGMAAENDYRQWQDRQEHGLVKVADKWMTVEERDALRGKSTDVAVELHDTIKAGRLKESGLRLDRALIIDPQNMSLLYLHGVLEYAQEHIPAARKAFEAVCAAAPDHAPTLNNLAVILWRQNAHPAALAYYDRALLAAPASPDILDNVAEALNALPKEQRESAIVKKLLRHFKESDDAMQKKMADSGQYRWGSSWVSEKELKRLQDQEKTVKDQLAQMQLDFETVQKRIMVLDRQISEIVSEMNLIDSQTYATNTNGQAVRLPYPPLYYTLSQQVATLKNERAARLEDLDHLRKAARQAQQQLPTPKYLGQQKLIDADGMPLPAGYHLPAPPAAAPSTQPSTQPATTRAA